MRATIKKHGSLIPLYITLLLSLVWLVFIYNDGPGRLFVTSDQLAYHHYEKKSYSKAAQTFENLSYKGASYYREASFKKAQSVYQNLSSRENTYNLGNVFVMLGDYDNAIKTYERALKIDPNFKEAQDNLVVAKARKILKEPENDGTTGIGEHMDMRPDEILYDNTEGKGVDDDKNAQKDIESGNPEWLDRLQTGPKDFLKNKFRYQYEMQESSNAN